MDKRILRHMVKLLAGNGGIRYAAGFAYVCAHAGAHEDTPGLKPRRDGDGEEGGMDAPVKHAVENPAEAPEHNTENHVQEEDILPQESSTQQKSPQSLSDMEAVLLGKFSLLEKGDKAALLRFVEYLAHTAGLEREKAAQEEPEGDAETTYSADAAVADWLDAQARLYTEE